VRARLELEWGENKRRRLIEERDLDILYAALIFEGPVLTWIDDRRDYGERRLISLGVVEREAFTVVHTERSGVTRLITAWKGGRHDLERYQAGVARRAERDAGAGGDPSRRPRD
jgi:uncharacterized DUF497 family protein